MAYQLKDKYPTVYSKLSSRIESDWEETEKLLKQAMDEGKLRRMPIPVVKLTIEGAIEKFLGSEELSKTSVSYEDALNGMIDIIINGLRV